MILLSESTAMHCSTALLLLQAYNRRVLPCLQFRVQCVSRLARYLTQLAAAVAVLARDSCAPGAPPSCHAKAAVTRHSHRHSAVLSFGSKTRRCFNFLCAAAAVAVAKSIAALVRSHFVRHLPPSPRRFRLGLIAFLFLRLRFFTLLHTQRNTCRISRPSPNAPQRR